MTDDTLQSLREQVEDVLVHRCPSLQESAEALLAEVDRLRDGITRHRDVMMSQLSSPMNVGHDGQPIIVPSADDQSLWALIGDDDA